MIKKVADKNPLHVCVCSRRGKPCLIRKVQIWLRSRKWRFFFYFLSFIQLVKWTLLVKLLGLTYLKWNRKHLVRTKGYSLLRRQAVKWDWFSFYVNHQVHWLSFGGLRIHGQQYVRQFGSTLTLNACEYCVHLEANYVTSDHRLASSPEKFSAVVMSGNSWSCLLVRGT